MPAYPHLMTRALNFRSIEARIHAAATLGAPWERELTDSEAMAKEQAAKIVKELVEQGGPATVRDSSGNKVALENMHVIALIAYLQRVGVDLFATETEEQPVDGQPIDESGLERKRAKQQNQLV